MSVEAALAVLRFVNDAAAMVLWGAFAHLAVLVPPALRRHLCDRFNAFRIAAILLAASTSLAFLPIEAASVGEGWADALDPATVGAMLGDTGVGSALLVRSVVALLLAATLPCRRPAVTAALSGTLLATLALTGHAAMDEGVLGLLHHLNDAAHVLAAGAWVGALVPLQPTLRALDDPRYRADAATALRRFSTLGHWDVALIIATGILNTALVLGRWPTDWTSNYQKLLAAKIALGGAMVGLALANRYILVPRMTRRDAAAPGAIRRATAVEVGLGFAAIACVSVFGLLDPS